jgi:hypothetical protein
MAAAMNKTSASQLRLSGFAVVLALPWNLLLNISNGYQ